MKYNISEVFSKRQTVYGIVYIILACLLTMLLPYAFPPIQVSHSYSYMVGFDNKLAFIILCLVAVPPLFFGYKYQNNVSVWHLEKCEPEKKEKRYLWLSIIITSLLVALTGIGFNLEQDFHGYFEGEYFYHFLYALDYNHSLYDEVQYIYGPLSIYPVYWLTKLGLGVSFSFFLVLILFQAFGIYFAFDLLSKLHLTSPEKKVIFILIVIITYPVATGFNYCIIRFTLVPWLCLNLISNFQRRNKFLNLLLSPLFFLISLAYSPEIGLCYLVIISIWLLFKTVFEKKWDYLVSALLIITSFIGVLKIYPDYFSSVFQAGAGGANFPYVPSLIIFLTVFVFIIYGFTVGNQAKEIKANIDLIALEGAMILASPAGLGRCDPGHILDFCMFAIIIAYIVARQVVDTKIVRVLFLVCVFTFFPFQIKCLHYPVARRIVRNATNYPQRVELYAQRQAELKTLLDNLSGKVTSVQCKNDIYIYLNSHYDYRETYFGYTPQWIGTKEGFDRELSELKDIDSDYIVVPVDYQTKWMDRKYMGISQLLYFTYYPIKPKRYYNEILYGELIGYLDNDFERIRSNDKYAVLKKK